MPKSVPSYRQRIGSDQVFVTLMDAMTKQRRDHWLGVHGMLGRRFSLRALITPFA